MSIKNKKKKTVPAHVHYTTMIALIIANICTFGLAMLSAAVYGQGVGNLSYMIETGVTAPSAYAFQSQKMVGNNTIMTNCHGTVGVIEGTGRGTAAFSNATVFVAYGSARNSATPYNGLITAEGFASDYQMQTIRVLEGSGNITFSGQNRVTVFGDAAVRLTGNYRFTRVPGIAYCPPVPAIEPIPTELIP